MRLIDVDAFKADYRMADECKDCKTNVRACEYDRVYTKMEFCSWLDDAPTVATERVRGKWIQQNNKGKPLYGWFFCSECGAFCGGETNFCSECGADMRKDEQE